MRVLLAGGGTAGHVNPALSIAQFIRQRKPDAVIKFVGTKEGIESRLVTNAGFDIDYVEVYGFYRKLTLKNVKTVVKAFTSTAKAKQIIREFAPDIVIGTGGYVSFPVLKAATSLGIPTAIHEQNAFPGMTSKILAASVDRVMLGLEADRKYFPKKADVRLVGNPLREGFVFADREKARAKLGIPADMKYVVSFAGSLGAREFNKAIIDFIKIHAPKGEYMHTHATGKYGYQWMPKELESYGINSGVYPLVDLREYIDNMQDVMAAADIVIGRAGANTLAEIMALGKPSVLIPSPNVTHNHQYYNAMSLVKNDAAVMIEEKDLSGEALYSKINELFESESKLCALSKNAQNMAMPDSAQKIYDIICELLDK